METMNPLDFVAGMAFGIYICVQLYCMRHLFTTKKDDDK